MFETIEVKETKHRGRPVIENSARQARLAKRAERLAKGGELKKGRPSNPNSARQLKMAARMNALQSGTAVKRGRPKTEKAVA